MTNRIFSTARTTRQDLIRYFTMTINDIHAERKFRAENWFQPEMENLLRHINWERAQRDKDPLAMRLLLRREIGASGHVDYAHKLAICAAELVLDEDGGS